MKTLPFEAATKGVKTADLFGEKIEVSISAARILGDTASNFTNMERQVIALWQGNRGGGSAAIAKRMGMKESEVDSIATRFLAALREQLLIRARQGIKADQLDFEGIEDAILPRDATEFDKLRDATICVCRSSTDSDVEANQLTLRLF